MQSPSSMKLGVFMLWTEMRTPQGGLLPGSAQHAAALSAVGLGQPFAHDDVIPEALQLGSLRPEPDTVVAHEPSPSPTTRKASKLSRSHELVGSDRLAKVVSTVRAKRAAAQPEAPATRGRGKSARSTSARSGAAKQLAAR